MLLKIIFRLESASNNSPFWLESVVINSFSKSIDIWILRFNYADMFLIVFIFAAMGALTWVISLSMQSVSTQPQTAPLKNQSATFGGAADNNTIFSPEEASGDAKTKTTTETQSKASRYTTVKYMTYALDYGFLFATFSAYEFYASGDKFTPRRAALIIPINSILLICSEVFKIILFSDVLPKVKLDHFKMICICLY